MPTCMECLSRGYTCVYAKAKKRGRKKQEKTVESTSPVDDDEEQDERSSSSTQSTVSAESSALGAAANNDTLASQNGHYGSSKNRRSRSFTGNGSPNMSGGGDAAATGFHPYNNNTAPSHNGNSNNNNSSSSSNNSNKKRDAIVTKDTIHRKHSPEFITQLIETYFQFVSVGTPLVEREAIESAWLQADHVNKNSPTEKKSMQALLYAILSVSLQRLGYRDDAKEMFEKTRELCLQADVYEQHISNYHVASAFVLLALWLIGEMRIDSAKLYLNNVYYFLEQMQNLESSNSLTEEQALSVQKLRKTVGCVELILCLNSFSFEEVEQKSLGLDGLCPGGDCPADVQIVNTQHNQNPQMRSNLRCKLEVSKRMLSNVQDPDLMAMIDSLIENDDKQCEHKNHMCIVLLQKTLDTLDRMDDKLTDMFRDLPVVSLSWSVCCQGYKLEVLADYEFNMIKKGDGSYLEKVESVTNLKRMVADRISRKVITFSTWYPLACNLLLKYVIMSSMIHTQHARAVKYYSDEEILAFLKADLWALETSSKRFTFPRSAEILKQVKDIIDQVSLRKALSEAATVSSLARAPPVLVDLQQQPTFQSLFDSLAYLQDSRSSTSLNGTDVFSISPVISSSNVSTSEGASLSPSSSISDSDTQFIPMTSPGAATAMTDSNIFDLFESVLASLPKQEGNVLQSLTDLPEWNYNGFAASSNSGQDVVGGRVTTDIGSAMLDQFLSNSSVDRTLNLDL